MVDEGVAHGADRFAAIRPLAAEFADRDMEAHYWLDSTPEAASGARRAGLVTAVWFLAFSLADLLAVGVGTRWLVLVLVRLGAIVPTLALVDALRRDPRLVRNHSLLTLIQATLFGGYQVVALLQPDVGTVETATVGVIVIIVFMLVPNRLVLSTSLCVVGCIVWVIASVLQGGLRGAEVAARSSVLVATMVIGFVGANRIATTSRREFAMRIRERSINERLSVEVAWRQRMEHELVRRANIDDLTGLANRRWFHELAEQELRRAQRHNHPLSVVVLDVDHFKAVNDTHGHIAGDEVLVELGRVLNEQVRRVDVLGRIGGEEFAVVMPGADLARCRDVSERLRLAVADLRFRFGGVAVAPTVSIGVTTCDVWTERLSEALDRADTALYQAKAEGRNCVVAIEGPTSDGDPQAARGDSWVRGGGR